MADQSREHKSNQERIAGGAGPYGRLLDKLPAAAYLCNAEGLITYFNEQAVQLWGRAPKLNDPADRYCGSFRLFATDGSPLAHDDCWMARVLKTGQEYQAQEIVIERPDGSRITALAHASPFLDEAGRLVGALNVLVDITARKRAEAELLASEVRFEKFTQHLPGLAWIKDLEGRYLFVNPAAERAFQQRRSEIYGKTDGDLFPPATAVLFRDNDRRALEGGKGVEAIETLEHTDGWHHSLVAKFPIPGAGTAPAMIGGMAIDITDRLQAEQALRQSEERLRLATQTGKVGIWDWDIPSSRVTWTESLYAIYGVARDEFDGTVEGFARILHPDDRSKVLQALQASLASDVPYEIEFRAVRPGGELVWLFASAVVLREGERPVRMLGATVDVTERKRAEQAVRESERRFRSMADNAPALIWVNDVAGCQFVNREYLQFLSCTLDEVRGAGWQQFVHPDDVRDYVALYAQAVADRAEFDALFRFRRADGAYRWLRSRGVPRFDAEGHLVGYVGCSIDVDESQRSTQTLATLKDELATQLADLRRLHEMSVRLSTTLELQPILEEALRTAAAIQGTDMGLLSLTSSEGDALELGASLGFSSEFLRAIDRVPSGSGACGTCFLERRRVIVEDIETDPRFEPYRHAARQAGFRAVHSTPLITRAGAFLGVLSVHFRQPRHPTDREFHLVDLCARQAADFIENAQLYAELREADRRKDEFLAMLAHELRNPLAPLSNSLQILRMSDDLSPAVQSLRDVMENQVTHLMRLVDDLMEVSRITRGKIELRKEPVELAAVIANAVEISRPLIDAAGHQLAITVCPEPVIVEADPVRLGQVVANLLNNAAKYTPEGGQIWLVARREGAEAVVSVRDTGIGIPREMLPRVFDMFAQLDGTIRRARGGLGIGLTLAKSLVEMHGGRIEAHSDGPGRGSTFNVRLPAPHKTGRPKVHSPAPRSGHLTLPVRNVLVVDDTEAAAYMLGRLLEKLGQRVRIAHSAAEALEMVNAEPPDVIISDLAMPQVDGLELARQLRQLSHAAGVTLVALTGYGQDSDRQMTHEAGFDLHIVKPAGVDTLQTLLASLPRRASRSPT